MAKKVDEANRRAQEAADAAEKAKETATLSQKRTEEQERSRRAAEEAAQNARMRQEEYQRAAAEAADAFRRAGEARLATERQWFKGVRPECRPSEEDIARMKAKYRYSPGSFHLAVVGSSGCGKSSFINAICGLSDNDPIAAPTGIVETTNTVLRYTDPRSKTQIFWYDVPGAGTADVPDWQYFNDLGLYIFDCIIVLIDNRVLDSDLAILRACEQFTNIEAFIVRSKSDQHILNMACVRMPRGKFIDETRQSVHKNLENKNLSPKKVYVVCKDAMLAIGNNLSSTKTIHEAELLNDIAASVVRRLH
ncbi:interferon-inducible GTPase-domain-containing protein [Suillus lakei]|nr:interferon-inducible GTPase-domain-containing protein [Suillus lakei]